MTQTARNIDRLSVTSLRLALYGGSQLLGSATGFVVETGSGYGLVTNRHVVTGRHPDTDKPLAPSGTIPDELRILNNVASNLGSWNWVSEQLYDQNARSPLWFEHPSLGTQFDVVLLPLSNLDDVEIIPLDLELRHVDVRLVPADTVSVIGFPLGRSAGGALAIWMTGTVASDPDVDYGGSPRFLIDATTRPSMSGSPVIARRLGTALLKGGGVGMFSGICDRFVGVYSGRIDDQSEIGIVWKADAVADLVGSVP